MSSSQRKCKCLHGRVKLTETPRDKGNYTVKLEANSKRNEPIYVGLLYSVLGKNSGAEMRTKVKGGQKRQRKEK